jgi:hypothetical protein
MHRLNHIYYTDKLLDGYVSQDGVRSQSPRFYQGEDLKLSFYLNYKGQPVTGEKYTLEVIVKKSPAAQNILWKGYLENGLYNNEAAGDFHVLIPSTITSNFLPGIYYLDVKLQEKVGEGDAIRDVSLIILSTTFTLELSAGSPFPKLAAHRTEERTYDPATGITTITITSVEPTLPKHTDKG